MKELISNGTDIIDIRRIEMALEKNRDAFMRKVFTDEETRYYEERNWPARSIAAAFSAKESVMKSLGRGMTEISFREIEILRDSHGSPHVVLHGAAVDRMREMGIREFLLSMSHEKDYALTFVVTK